MSNTTRSSNLETAAHPEKLHRVAIDPISQLLKGQGLVPLIKFSSRNNFDPGPFDPDLESKATV